MKNAIIILAAAILPCTAVSAQNVDPAAAAKANARGMASEMQNSRSAQFERDLRQDNLDETSYIDAYERARKYTNCVARTGSKKLHELLGTNPGSDGEAKAARYVMTRYKFCSEDISGVSMRFLRGGAAESLLRDELSASDNGAIKSVPLETLAARTPDQEGETNTAFSNLQSLAECRVAQSSTAVAGNLRKPVAEGSKSGAEGELATATTACGPGIGNDVIVGLLQRSFLAEALYHSQADGAGK